MPRPELCCGIGETSSVLLLEVAIVVMGGSSHGDDAALFLKWC